ncbi:MAG: hypothetical protein KAW91_07290 [candidate division Zixibacteria bacterium]|nr:hypothetical protein [candidate division Zixibacteria bacterium]
MGKVIRVLLLGGMTALAACATPQEREVSVGDIDLPLRWGEQKAVFEITNETEEAKFLTVETEVQFTGSYLSPNRRARSHFILLPSATQTVSPVINIPGNYGQAEINLSVYDVVDTLDVVLPDQKRFEQHFSVVFHAPEAVLGYVQEKINLPPRVAEHPYFDNEFSRAFLLMLSEGKSLEDIAALVKTDVPFVRTIFDRLVDYGYATESKGFPELLFPVIEVPEAEEAKQLAERTADSLVRIISNNLPAYWNVVDSLVAAGKMSGDKNKFLDGGAVLYRTFPTIAALSLWFDMGQRFITRSAPLLIYNGTDPCNARIPDYMYAVRGGDYFNGTNFYALFYTGSQYKILYGDSLPEIECEEDFILKRRRGRRPIWNMAKSVGQESFMIDTSVVRPALTALSNGADSLLSRTYFDLKDIAIRHGHLKVTFGARYWFWNVVASRTVVKLTAAGLIERRGSGQFQIQGLRPKKGK